MESIYDYINRNIKENGILKEDFNLDKYIGYQTDEFKFALGALDGIMYFHSKIEVDKEQLDFLKNSIKDLQDDYIEIIANSINEYYKNNEKTFLSILDSFLGWIIANSSDIDNSLLFKFGIFLVLYSVNIEAVKIGTSMLGLFDFSDNENIIELVEKLALCDEFTLYVDIALSNIPNANDIRFMLAKKVYGWGKIYLVDSLENEDERINEWLITSGCDNGIGLGYLAYEVANKINLLKVLKRTNLSNEEFKGICDIMEGLIKEKNFKGISFYENYLEIFQAFLKHFEKHIDNVDYYNIPIMILKYIFSKGKKSQQDIAISKKIVELLDSDEVYNTLKKEIREERKLRQVIEILKSNSKIKLDDEVFEKFKENPVEKYYCLEYLLQKDEYFDKSLEILSNAIKLQEHYAEPKAIMGLLDVYSNNLSFIIQTLKEYPCKGKEFIVAGLKSKTMQPRNSALNTIKEWINRTSIKKEELPSEIYKALLELKEKEIIKNYKEIINEILGVNEDLSDYEEPEICWNIADKGINIDIYSDEIEELFEPQIKIRGMDYYSKNMVYSLNKSLKKYIAFVQGSEFGKEYEVNIIMNEENKVQKMECNCPYLNNCKHEYAVILCIRDKYKNI